MKQERLAAIKEDLERIRLLAEAEVVRHDRGPESEPSPELLRALSYTSATTRALSIVALEQFEQTGATAWLNQF